MGIAAVFPMARRRMPAAQKRLGLPWAPPSLSCWEKGMQESVSCRAVWVLCFPGSLLHGFLLPPNPQVGGGGIVVSVIRSS